MLTKDAIKEAMMGALSVNDREASKQLGAATFRVLFTVSQSLLDAGVGVVLEGPFSHPRAHAELRALGRGARAMLIHCVAPTELVLARYRERYKSGQRHPGHFDGAVLPELAARIQAGEFGAPQIDVPTLTVDTREGYDPTLDQIVSTLRST